MNATLETNTSLTDTEITSRVQEVNDFERFAVFTFSFKSEQHQETVLGAPSVIVTSADGSTYLGHVEDWDDSHFYVNLD